MGDDPEVKTVIGKEFKELEEALTGPGPLTPETRKRVDLFTLRNLCVLVMRTTVTEAECRERMGACAGSCDAKTESEKKQPDPSLDPRIYLIREAMKWIPAPVLGFGYLIGKGSGWW